MLNNQNWRETSSNQITLPSIHSKPLKYILEFFYSQACVFPRDDIEWVFYFVQFVLNFKY